MKLEFSQQIFEKSSNIKFHENMSSGSRVVPCRRTDGYTGMMKLIVAFRSFAKKPKNYIFWKVNLCLNWVQSKVCELGWPFVLALSHYRTETVLKMCDLLSLSHAVHVMNNLDCLECW
jgi:hypothetical protein